MKPTSAIPRLTIVASLLLATVHLAAQTASNPSTPPAPSTPPSEENNSEVIQLSTFEVTPSNTHSYTADDTTSGTRVRANLRDLPFVVNVITSDFINDFAAFEFNDQVSNVSSLSISEVEGTYQLRGIPVTTQLVDGFRRLGLIDSVDVDRIDVIKGPYASIYGYIQPGGVVNITTKKPLTHHEDSVAVYAGDYDFFRFEAYSTGPMGDSGKLFYRVDFADEHRDYQQRYKTNSRSTGTLQFLWKPNADTSLNLSLNDTVQDQHRGNQLIVLRTANTVTDPYRVFTSGAQIGQNQTIGNYNVSLAYANNPYNAALYNFNNSGPGEYNNRRVKTASLIYEHKINSIFSIREGFNWFDRDFLREYVDGSNYGIQAQSISGQSPEFDDQTQRNTANQVDLTAKFNTGPISHQMLLTADFSGEVDRFKNLRMDPTNAAAQPVNTISNFTNPNYGFTSYQQNPLLYDQQQQNYWDAVYDYGLFLNEHASMFKNRLNLIAGLRLDWLNTRLADYAVNNFATGTSAEQDFDVNTRHYPSHQLGVSYRVIDTVTLFANQSNSIDPQPNYIPGTGQITPNSTSNGYEFGAKMALFKNRLSLSVTHYVINLYNQTYATTDTLEPSGGTVDSAVTIPQQVSRGDEVDMSWSVNSSLQLQGYYSHDSAIITQSDPHFLFLQGTSTRRVPANQFGGALRYQFRDGILKGFYVTAKENYYSKSVVNISGGRAASGSGYINTPIKPGSTVGPFSFLGVPLNAPVPLALTTRGNGAPNTSTIDPLLVHLPDGREQIYNAPWATTDIGVGYTFKTGTTTHRVQLNVKNVLNRHYTTGSGIAGDPLTYIVSYKLTF